MTHNGTADLEPATASSTDAGVVPRSQGAQRGLPG